MMGKDNITVEEVYSLMLSHESRMEMSKEIKQNEILIYMIYHLILLKDDETQISLVITIKGVLMVEILMDLIITKIVSMVIGELFVRFILSPVIEPSSVEVGSIKTLFSGKEKVILGLEVDSITEAFLVPFKTTMARVLVFKWYWL